MTTVVLDNVRVELTAEHVIAAFRQLPPPEQELVRRELTHAEWESRLRDLLARIWARLEARPLSDEEIDEEIRIVREARRVRRLAAESDR